MQPSIEPIVGRYLNIEIDGRPQRIYFEEAGEGIPLLCVHTAGSDGRQWRHILNDEEITRSFRVINFDLPWHGKSYPPPGFDKETYELTTNAFMSAIRSVSVALALNRPVFMGCSIGGRIVLDLARFHGREFRGLIGVQCSDHHVPWYDSTWINRPDIHGGEFAAALVSGMMAPQSPAQFVQETLWTYKQAGPGVFKGDLHFYGTEGDFREETARIDNSACPLYLLTGEYDYSATPEDTLSTASRMPGAYVQIMKDVGHFPMSENPAQFRTYLMPVLEKIIASSASA